MKKVIAGQAAHRLEPSLAYSSSKASVAEPPKGGCSHTGSPTVAPLSFGLSCQRYRTSLV